jgi:SAM-dependent methyltransferase
MDLWGRIYLDHWRGDPHPHLFARDDGKRDTVRDAAGYFVAPRGVADRAALDALTGRVLDLGSGPGSYARYLEERGREVVAIDASAGAIAVCRERGCRDARVVEIDAVDPALGVFDAVICMGNTFGIGRAPETLPDRLSRLRSILVPNGALVVSMIDPLATSDPSHLAYHERNRAAGRPPGLTRTRLEYRGETGDWWELWMPTLQELTSAAAAADWTVTRVVSEGSSRLCVLEPNWGQSRSWPFERSPAFKRP